MNELASGERRGLPRIERRLPVRFELAGGEETAVETHVGTIANFTEDGLRLESNDLCPPGGDVTLFIQVEGRHVVLLARVVWWRMEPFAHVEQMRFSCGLRLLYDVPQWREYVTRVRKEPSLRPAGADARFEAVHRVKFAGDREFLSDFTQNISRGGMYLATDRKLAVGAEIELAVELPGMTDAIPLKATVVYKLDAAAAKELGRGAGVGVKFVSFTDPERELFAHHIRRLEVHRTRAGRLRLEEIPKAGSLADYLVPELLISSAHKGFTGVIELEHRGIFKRVYVKNGLPIYVDSSLVSDRFGEFLVQSQQLSSDDLRAALAHGAQNKLKIGEALIALGKLTKDSLASALISCHEHKLYDTFAWFDGSFSFVTLEAFPSLVSPLVLRTEALVFEGVRHCYDAEVVCAWTGMSRETQLVCRQGQIDGLPADVAKVIEACAAPITIETLMQKTDQRFETVVPLAYAMLLFGWIEAVRAETVAPEESLPEVPVEPEAEDLPEVDVEADVQPAPAVGAAQEPALNDQQKENLQKAKTFADRGEELLRKGDIIGAYKQYSLAVAFAPTDAKYSSRLTAIAPLANEKRARELSDTAQAAASNGDPLTAAKQYEEAAALMPEAGRFAHLAAEMYLKGEQLDAALRMAEMAVSRSKDNPKYRVCLVEALRRVGQSRRAEEEMRIAMTMAPKDPAVTAQAARLGIR